MSRSGNVGTIYLVPNPHTLLDRYALTRPGIIHALRNQPLCRPKLYQQQRDLGTAVFITRIGEPLTK